MDDRRARILSKTLIFGGLYCLATLVFGFFGMSFVSGMAMGEAMNGRQNGVDSAEGALKVLLAIVQPVAVLIAWLGAKKPNIHEHVSLGHLVLISCAWSFVVGFVYAMLTTRRDWSEHEQKA